MALLSRDFAITIRTLARRPAFAAVVVGTLAVAIAANTVVFSTVYGVLLRPLPFRHPDRLAALEARAHTGFTISLSIPNYRDWRDRNRVFESFGASAGWGLTLTGAGPAEVLTARLVIGDFFGVLGLRPFLGRLPSAEETAAHPGMQAVAVLGYGLWQRRFGGDSGIIGAKLVLSGTPYTVIGVLPPGVGFPVPDVEVYAPMGSLPDLPWDDRDSGFGTSAIARLKPNVDLTAAQRDLDRVGRDVRVEADPTAAQPEIRSLSAYYVAPVRAQLWILMGAVGFVLLIATANVGNLLLARRESRQRELMVRTALGADRWAIARLLLAEAMVLAAAGSVLGAVLAYVALGAVVPLLPAELPAVLVPRIRIDAPVLAFAIVVAPILMALVGVVPALRTVGSIGAQETGSRTTAGKGRGLRPALVVSEISLALIVLIGAGLMLRSLDRLGHVDKGFDESGVLTVAVPASEGRYSNEKEWRIFYGALRDRTAELPGVHDAALALLLPLSNRSWELRIHPDGVPVARETGQSVLYNVVSPEYFAAMGVPILQGRSFLPADRDGAALVAIVDETMARRFWPGANPIGRQVTFEEDSTGAPVYRTVVGVAKNVRHYELETPSRIQVYVPVDQSFRRWGMTLRLVIKTDRSPEVLARPVRELVRRLDADAPIVAMQPLESYVNGALARSRAMTRVLAAFAVAALALAVLGIFGVMSYEVSRRTREIGIRIALGAAARDVARWIAARTLRLTLLGLGIGLSGAAALTGLLRGMLFEVSPLNPGIYGIAAVGLTATALAAAYLPARRATRVDPVTVLRDEA